MVGVFEGVGVQVGVGVRVGKVGIGVGVPVDLGVLLGLMVAVAGGVSGVQVGCKEVGVALGTVGTRAILATVGNGVDVARASAIWAFTSLLIWFKLARNPGEMTRKMKMRTARAAKMSNTAVITFMQLLKQPLLELF